MTLRGIACGLVVSLGLVTAGCGPFDRPSQPLRERDVVGTFEMDWTPHSGVNLGRETIVVKSNHQFEQTFVSKGAKAKRNTGSWSLRAGGDALITLDGFVQYTDSNHTARAAKPESTVMYAGVSKHGTGVWILMDDDLALWYKKK